MGRTSRKRIGTDEENRRREKRIKTTRQSIIAVEKGTRSEARGVK